ncbi:FadR/GntR family transcriptional regulator [Streptomyces sp. NBC_00859]|uniref:FadR/GntR family transcriptional regulator n=1 Tax=Streptomyces sp. NBC_00859 TaxID=2903682 RepID=UPI0038647110|nr:FadR family transcriptional regulator [Streptomyces sp. NBC_00859]
MAAPGPTSAAAPDPSYIGRGVHRFAVEALALRIFDGTYAEGATVDLPQLMAELDVSQTVLREAIKVLTVKGLLDARQRRGTFVRARENWNLLDSDVLRWRVASGARDERLFDELFELRRSVEPAAAALAAQHRTDDDLAALTTALGAMERAGSDPVGLVPADAAFHTALLAASHNRFFVQMQRVMIPALIERDRVVHAGSPEHPLPTHVAVADRVRARDQDGASLAMVRLLDAGRHDHHTTAAGEPAAAMAAARADTTATAATPVAPAGGSTP